MTTTDRNVKDLVVESLGSDLNSFDVDAIVSELVSLGALTSEIEEDIYWGVVAKYVDDLV